MERSEKHQQLVALGADKLASTLLALAERHDPIATHLNALLSESDANINQLRQRLAAMAANCQRHGADNGMGMVAELEAWLFDLGSSVDEARMGLELLAECFALDAAVYEHAYEAQFEAEYFFTENTVNLFARYAQANADLDWLIGLLLRLCTEDEYRLRASLIDAASSYLPGSALKQLLAAVQSQADSEPAGPQRQYWLEQQCSLARQLGDAALFAQTLQASKPQLSDDDHLNIAQVHADNGDDTSALASLARMTRSRINRYGDSDQLLLAIHQRSGNTEQRDAVAWRMFRMRRSGEAFARLLEIIGKEQRATALASEREAICAEPKLSLDDAQFLLDQGETDAADTYLLQRHDQFNGDAWYQMAPLARALDRAGKALVSSLLYRALTDRILARGKPRTYHHGGDYLRRLDVLAPQVEDWQSHPDHAEYLSRVRELHKRKRSFWPHYRTVD